MKRRLVMIRHAKSSWSNPLLSDYERPLNDRGEHDAPMMGARLKKLHVIPDLIISSPAKRAAQTAKRIAAAVDYPAEKIVWQEALYHCITSVFEEILYDLDDDLGTVFIVAHNPGISEFANTLSQEVPIDSMPTCAVVGVEMKSAHWDDLRSTDRKVFLFDYPKKKDDA